jgi:hypothetical protein
VQVAWLCVLLVVHLAVFLAPGLVGTATLRRERSGLDGWTPALAISGTLAFVAFFAYYLAPNLGRAFSTGVLIVTLALLGRRFTRLRLRAMLGSVDMVLPLALIIAFGTVFTGSVMLRGGIGHPTDAAVIRYTHPLPPDNVLPIMLAGRVIDGQPVEPFFADWLSSDRPPLQAGALALVSPLMSKPSREFHYQAQATALQLLVIAGMWALVRRAGMSVTTTFGVVLATCFTGTMVLHSTYVWPKLLSAAYCLLVLAEVLPRARAAEGRHSVLGRAAFVGWTISLAMTSHGGAIFLLAPMALVLGVSAIASMVPSTVLRGRWKRRSGRGRAVRHVLASTTVAVAIGVAVYSPWLAYQHFVAPPGNRLMKWHLAGQIPIDRRGFGATMVDAYTDVPLSTLLANKRSNVRELVNSQRFLADILPIIGGRDSIWRVRAREFGHVGNTVAVSLIGVAIGLAGVATRVVRRLLGRVVAPADESCAAQGAALACLMFAMLATLLWALVLYGPKGTDPHAGSLAVPLLFFMGGALAAASVNRRALALVVVASAYRCIRVWLFAPSLTGQARSPSALLVLWFGLALVAGLAVAVMRPVAASGWWTRRRPSI